MCHGVILYLFVSHTNLHGLLSVGLRAATPVNQPVLSMHEFTFIIFANFGRAMPTNKLLVHESYFCLL